jgi:ABC-type antimicrobial peptide transport system permease subunit
VPTEIQSLWVKSGLAGIAAVFCYFLAILISWPENQVGTSTGLLVVSAFPILGIVFSYGIHSALAAERESTASRLGFVFAAAGFAMLMGMIFVQLAVGAGIGEMTKGLDEETAKALRRGLRLIDLGLDVAWDFLMGTAMIFWGVVMRRRSAFGPWWGIPLVVLGGAVIVLNAATFPWPPGSRGLVDIGPVIALFFVGMAARLILLGRSARA